jgi:hypothetical protein
MELHGLVFLLIVGLSALHPAANYNSDHHCKNDGLGDAAQQAAGLLEGWT